VEVKQTPAAKAALNLSDFVARVKLVPFPVARDSKRFSQVIEIVPLPFR
jgi:hypothetical protein